MRMNSNLASAGRLMTGTVALALALATLSSTAAPPRERRAAPPPWRGHIERFHEHDWNLWREGRWVRTRHDGRLGWWWIVGSSWYFYPTPVYPYPNPWEPPPITLTAPPPTAYWYYCDASRGYFPYVPECASGWRPVPATPAEPMQPFQR
jgi:hypothetical protein